MYSSQLQMRRVTSFFPAAVLCAAPALISEAVCSAAPVLLSAAGPSAVPLLPVFAKAVPLPAKTGREGENTATATENAASAAVKAAAKEPFFPRKEKAARRPFKFLLNIFLLPPLLLSRCAVIHGRNKEDHNREDHG